MLPFIIWCSLTTHEDTKRRLASLGDSLKNEDEAKKTDLKNEDDLKGENDPTNEEDQTMRKTPRLKRRIPASGQ